MRRAVLVLAWWFAVTSASYSRTTNVVGPFKTQAACEKAVEVFLANQPYAHRAYVSVPCWEGP